MKLSLITQSRLAGAERACGHFAGRSKQVHDDLKAKGDANPSECPRAYIKPPSPRIRLRPARRLRRQTCGAQRDAADRSTADGRVIDLRIGLRGRRCLVAADAALIATPRAIATVSVIFAIINAPECIAEGLVSAPTAQDPWLC